MPKNIVQLKFSELDQYNLRPYGTCSTESATAAKVVTCQDFVSLVDGATILVKFTYGNTGNATLNVNNTGAKSTDGCKWDSGDILEFRYNGTSWDTITGVEVSSTNTHYTPTSDVNSLLSDTQTAKGYLTDSTEIVTKCQIERDSKGHVVGLKTETLNFLGLSQTISNAINNLNVSILDIQDSYLPLSGGAMSGAIDMGYSDLTFANMSISNTSSGLVFTNNDIPVLQFSNGVTTIGDYFDINLNADGLYIDASGGGVNILACEVTADCGIWAGGFHVEGSSNNYVLLGGGGTKLLSDITAGLATETFVTTKISEASLSGGDVDLSGYATKDDLSDYLPLTGGTLTGPLIISTSSSIWFGDGAISGMYTVDSGKNNILSFVSDEFTFNNTITSPGFVVNNSTNNYVLLGGGGTKLLSEITAGYATKDDLTAYLPLTGGTLTGDLRLPDDGLLVFGNLGSIETSYSMMTLVAPMIDLYASITRATEILADSFVKVDSSDSYVLLGGGGTKAISDFALASSLENYLPLAGGTMTGTINSQHVIPVYNSTYDLGSSSKQFNTTYTQSIDTGPGYTLRFKSGGDERLNISSAINATANILPTAADTYDLGNSSYKWKNVYATTFTGDGAEFKLQLNEIVANCNVSAPAFYETSDIRKKNIKSDLSLDKCYDLIDKCQTVIYSLKDQTKEQVGMIAQEIEEFFPEVVATDEEGFKSLAYDRLVVICFKVLKDVIKRLDHIENTL